MVQSLEEAVRAACVGGSAGGKCTLKMILEKMSPADKTTVKKLLKDPTVKMTALSRVLRERGILASPWTLRRHGRDECQDCQKPPAAARGAKNGHRG
jgi:hypothetical protein